MKALLEVFSPTHPSAIYFLLFLVCLMCSVKPNQTEQQIKQKYLILTQKSDNLDEKAALMSTRDLNRHCLFQ